MRLSLKWVTDFTINSGLSIIIKNWIKWKKFPAVTEFMRLLKNLKKIQDFNGIWTRNLAIPVRCSNQLSYEATEIVNCVHICSRERDECDRCTWNKSYKNCGNEIKKRRVLALVNGIYQLPKEPTTGLICFWMFLWVSSFKVREWRNLLLSYDVMSIFLNIFF